MLQILAFLCTNFIGKAPCGTVPPAPGAAPAATARRSLSSRGPAPTPGCTAYYRQARPRPEPPNLSLRLRPKRTHAPPLPPARPPTVASAMHCGAWPPAERSCHCTALPMQVTVLSSVSLIAQPPKYYNGNWVRSFSPSKMECTAIRPAPQTSVDLG